MFILFLILKVCFCFHNNESGWVAGLLKQICLFWHFAAKAKAILIFYENI